jgi:uncharacterized repeat protein (TIGR03803 family)
MNPRGNLVFDRKGNLYGTTQNGGTFGCGTVYELVRSRSAWTENVLHNFPCDGSDGLGPLSGVIFDDVGNLWGVTVGGGSAAWGTVFRLTPPSTAGGSWTETVVYNFQGGNDGEEPFSGMVYAGNNKFYGFTPYGGSNGWGVFYEVTASGTERVLHTFGVSDGQAPDAVPILDSLGNVYGTTNVAGPGGNGTVFKFTPPTSGVHWLETGLFSFNGTDGNSCQGIVFDSAGNLYGSSFGGGTSGNGVIFELTPPASGSTWTQTVLHNFAGGSADGAQVWAAPILVNGVLYGVTHDGGVAGQGVVFAITP